MILSDVPPPHNFLNGFVIGFNRYVREQVAPGHEHYNALCSLERGWIWLPDMHPLGTFSNGMALLLQAEHIMLTCLGCKFSKTRTRYFHVGTSWAPEERLPNPIGAERDRGTLWNDPIEYDQPIREMHKTLCDLHDALKRLPNVHEMRLFEKSVRFHGWLLNDTPRKKRAAKIDPMMQILRAGGLLA